MNLQVTISYEAEVKLREQAMAAGKDFTLYVGEILEGIANRQSAAQSDGPVPLPFCEATSHRGWARDVLVIRPDFDDPIPEFEEFGS